MRELGCSKCRFAAGGCARCRKPSFRPRAPPHDLPREALRQVVAQERQLQRAARRQVAKEQRREASRRAGQQQRELLLGRLRRQLGEGTDEVLQSDDAPAEGAARRNMQPKRQRHSPCNVNDAALGQPPAKSRRVRKSQTHREVHAEESHPSNDPFEANEGVTEGSVSSDVSSMQVDSPIVDDGTAATGATQTGAPPPSAKRNFLELLEENMSRRREARLSGASSPSELLAALPQPKRRRTSTGAIPGSGSKICRPLGPDEDPRKVLWEPPVSPYGLLEEELYDDPWKLLTACMLLNKTTGTQVRKIIWDLFQLCPTPQAAVAADTSRIQDLIQPLGLFRKRAVAIQRLSEDYLNKAWRDPQELYGIGKYAADAYYIFCRGAWKDVQPEDKDLRRYVEWLEQTGGLGSGLMRHRTEQEPVGVSV